MLSAPDQDQKSRIIEGLRGSRKLFVPKAPAIITLTRRDFVNGMAAAGILGAMIPELMRIAPSLASQIIVPPGLRRLGSLNFASTGASQGPITIAACKFLFIVHGIIGYSGSDIATFQLNADTTATNYGSGFQEMTAAANAATGSFLTTGTVVNSGTIAGIPVSGIPLTTAPGARVGDFTIHNPAANRKIFNIRNSNESTTATWPTQEFGWGEWLNTSAQITSIKMLTKSANNLLAGSFAIIYGDNP